MKEGYCGMLSAFETESGIFRKTSGFEGLPPVIPFVGYDEGRLLYCSYGVGTVCSVKLSCGGACFGESCTVSRSGSSLDQIRQTGPHPHSVWTIPGREQICVCDLGTDTLAVYDISGQGELTERQELSVQLPGGEGPRHLVFHPDGTHAYLLTEMGYHIYCLKYEDKHGFRIIGCVDPGSGMPASERAGAAIRMTRDGKYLYCSNRGKHESRIDCFKLHTPTEPEQIEGISKNCSIPRDFIVTQNERFMLCANQGNNTVSLYERDKTTGMLREYDVLSDFDSPACVLERENVQQGNGCSI